MKGRSTGKATPPTGGLAFASILWWWGALGMYAPGYASARGWVATGLSVLGWVLIALSLAGAGIELERLLKNKALSYWGIGLLFAVPGAVIHIAATRGHMAGWMSWASRAAVLLSVGLGSAFITHGIPYAFWRPDELPLAGREVPSKPGPLGSEDKAKFIGAVVAAVLNPVTAILKLLTASS